MFQPTWLLRLTTGLIACLPAIRSQNTQNTVDADAVGRNFAAGGDLVELRWQRDAKGRLCSAAPGSSDFTPLIADHRLGWAFEVYSGFGHLALLINGRNGLLGMTDGEQHLRRLGIGGAKNGDLLEFVEKPIPGIGKELAEAELLDRLVAVDVLRRRGAKGSIPRLETLADGAKTPEPLRQRVIEAAAMLRGAAGAQRLRLDPSALLLPVAADFYLVVDWSRLPEMPQLAALARSMGMLACLQLVRCLKAPFTDDLVAGQRESEVCGELPFELARRYGDQRIDHLFVAIVGQLDSGTGVCAQMVGSFAPDRLTALREDLSLPEEVKIGTSNGVFSIEAPDVRVQLDKKAVTVSSRRLRGRPRPELAAELLAGDAGFRVVIPAQSKVWAGLVTLGLPPVQRGEASLTFASEWVMRVTITARDEDASEEWVAKAKEFLQQQNEKLLGSAEDHPALKDVLTAARGYLAKAEIVAKGRVAVATISAVPPPGLVEALVAHFRKQ